MFIFDAFSTTSHQPPEIVANRVLLRRKFFDLHTLMRPETRAGGEVGLMYARHTTLGKDGYARRYKMLGR